MPAAVVAALWQAALVGWAAWGANAAARAAARAHAVEGDAAAAARRHLPRELERELRVTAGRAARSASPCASRRLPALPSLGHLGAEGHFEPQA